MSDSVRPHLRQPTRLPHPWDSPGKSTGVGCHFLLQCMKVKSEREVTQSCPTLRDPTDCSPPGPPSMGFSRQEYRSGCHALLQVHVIVAAINVEDRLHTGSGQVRTSKLGSRINQAYEVSTLHGPKQ